MGFLDRVFKLSENKTSVRTEVFSGITIFMTMAYILVVHPNIMSDAGMDKEAVFTATAISAIMGCFLMGLIANLPIALAPGLGINAFFAYTVVLTMGYSWQMALAGVFISSVLFVIISFLNIRDRFLALIPTSLKAGISVGIGLFIALVGLFNAGVIVKGADGSLSTMGDIHKPEVFLTLLSVVFTGILLVKNVSGSLLIGIVITTLVGIGFGITELPDSFNLFSLPPSVEPLMFKFDFSQIFSLEMVMVVFIFCFIDFFDTAGSLIAVCFKGDLLDKDGEPKNAKRAFISDSFASLVGSCVGSSPVTSFMESSAGIAQGGRTGLTAVTTGVLFILALFAFPLFSIVPVAATSAVLVLVGLFMCSAINQIDFNNYKDSLPAFITMIMLPLSYSIADGVMYGFLAHVIILSAAGEVKKLSVWIIPLVVLFVLKILFD